MLLTSSAGTAHHVTHYRTASLYAQIGMVASSLAMITWYDAPFMDELFARAVQVTGGANLPQVVETLFLALFVGYSRLLV